MIPFEWVDIKIKKQPNSRNSQLLPEEKSFLNQFSEFIILDSNGKAYADNEFSLWLHSGGNKHFVVGPSVGFHSDFIERASHKISLSSLTLTHSLAQLVFAETLYRAVCIAQNHPFAK